MGGGSVGTRTWTADHDIVFIPCEPLFLSDKAIDAEAVFQKIRMGRGRPNLFLITRSEREGELFVIYSATELSQPFYQGRTFYVAGIGRGRRQTLTLLSDMVEQLYRETMGFDVNHYFIA